MTLKQVSFARRLQAQAHEARSRIAPITLSITRRRVAARLAAVAFVVTLLAWVLHVGTRDLRDQARKDRIVRAIELSGVNPRAPEDSSTPGAER